MFANRKLIIATKHQKEKVIAPLLESELGVKCIVPDNFDTNILGTFSGEIERIDDPITTLRKKCEMAIEKTGCDLVVGNEGSFGPHPTIFFANADDEFVMLIDKKNGLEILERELNTNTNFNGQEVCSEPELLNFAEKVKFPSHGLVLKKGKEDYSRVIKGIINTKELIAKYRLLKNEKGCAYVETDMRAMFNPSRMSNIEIATKKLIKKIKSLCPQCKAPGFGITDSVRGLPCSQCGFPTRSILSYIYKCEKCGFKKEEKYPLGKTEEDPMYCEICNP